MSLLHLPECKFHGAGYWCLSQLAALARQVEIHLRSICRGCQGQVVRIHVFGGPLVCRESMRGRILNLAQDRQVDMKLCLYSVSSCFALSRIVSIGYL